MFQVCFSQLSAFFLTIVSFEDKVNARGWLLGVLPVRGVLVGAALIDTVWARNVPVFRRTPIKFCGMGAGSFLATSVVCTVVCFLAGPSWAAPTAQSEPIATELERHLVVSTVSEEHHEMVGGVPLFDSDIGDSVSGTSMPQVPVDLLTEPQESESQFQPIPEPSSMALLGGLGGLLFFIHRLRAYFDRSAVR